MLSTHDERTDRSLRQTRAVHADAGSSPALAGQPARRIARRLANRLFVQSLQEVDPLLRPPLRVAGHGAGEQQYRATEHEGIEQVVQAIVEAGAFHYRDRPVHD